MTSVLDQLRILNSKRTPGRWEYHAGVPKWVTSGITGSVYAETGAFPVVHKPKSNDALFIVAATNQMSVLIAAIDAAHDVVLHPTDNERYLALRAALAPLLDNADS